jgi:hypothetical protein
LESTTSDSVTESEITVIVVRADNFGVGASEDRITEIVGASIEIVTEENSFEDATSVLIASIIGTDRRIVTDKIFGPIAVIGVWSVTFGRRNKDDTSVNGASEVIVAIGMVDTSWAKIWTVFRTIRDHTALKENLRSDIGTFRSSILRKFINNVFFPLSAVEAITFRPICKSIFTRFWTESNLIRWTFFGSDITVRLRTRSTSTNFSHRNNKGLSSGTISSVKRTVARA